MSIKEIGVITKPQGLKGHFRVRIIYSNFSMSDIEEVQINNTTYKVEKITPRKAFYVFKLKNIDDIDAAERLRGESIFATIKERTLEKGEYFIDQLVGASVYVGEHLVGQVKTILQHGAADVFEITGTGAHASFMFPFARDVLISFDKDKNSITLNEKILNEIKLEI